MRRLLLLIPTLLGSTLVVFLLIRLVPGTVVDQLIGANAAINPEGEARLREYFGLDRPLHVQYLDWLLRAVRGNLGNSFRTGQPVLDLVISHLLVSLELALLAVLFATLIGIPLGVAAAFRQNTLFDGISRFVSLVGLSMPVFWQATMMLLILSKLLRWSPPLHWSDPVSDPVSNLQMMILPAIALATVSAAVIMRMTRTTVLEVLGQDYIRTARAKGLTQSAVLIRHALRNALLPTLTVIGLQFGYLIGGVVVVEEVFTLPGAGRLILNAIYERDYPVLQGGVLLIALTFMLLNLAVDLCYAVLDPRIRYT
jgi:peptide/nickel transport system permease protein